MSEVNIENITKSGSSFAPTFIDHHELPHTNLNGHLYISYILNPCLRNIDINFTLNNCLLGSVKLTKNADLYKYKYSSNVIGFDSRLGFLFTDGSMGKNVVVFEVYMSLSVHIDNKNKYILIQGEGLTQGLEDAILTAEANILLILHIQEKDLH